jgi:hypothetical protein
MRNAALALWLGVTIAILGCTSSGRNKADVTAPVLAEDIGSQLGIREPLVMRFSESIAEDSLIVSGSLLETAHTATWSAMNFENDTLTLAPSVSWQSGVRSLSLNVTDAAGNALEPVSASFEIRLQFSNFQNAAAVIGQTDFTSTSCDTSASTLDLPSGGALFDAVSNRLYVADYRNHRVVGYDGLPNANGAAASWVVGQGALTLGASGLSASRINGPASVWHRNDVLSVTELVNNRVSFFSPVPESTQGVMSVVVGQPDKTTNGTTCSADGLNQPANHIITPDGKLVVADGSNSRILVWSSVPSSDGQPADLVLGQNAFTTCGANDDDQDGISDSDPTSRTLSSPAALWSDGQRLVSVEVGNSRVLIWNQFPTANFQPADVVLGQADFTHAVVNDDDQNSVVDTSPSARTLKAPYLGVASNGLQLFVTDTGNNRVMIWNSFPTANYQAADVVLGQSDFAHAAQNDDDQDGPSDASASARTLHEPQGVSLAGDKLIVSDGLNCRVLLFQAQ